MKRLLLISLLLFPPPLQSGQKQIRTQLLMGNVPVSITIQTEGQRPSSSAYEAMEKAFAEAKRIEDGVSEWKGTSQTSLLNQQAGRGWVPIGRDLMEILRLARQVSEWTDGAFDVTFASPRRDASFRDLELIPELSLARLRRSGVRIGVSGIAKGYIVDQISRILRQEGFHRFLVNAGDLYASGRWEIKIRDPDGGEDQTICQLKVTDQAVSTSGLYERGPHIIDPRSKQPTSPLKSVTVIAKRSFVADPLATGGFVLGKDQLRILPEKNPAIGIIFVDDQGFIGKLGRVSAVCRGG